MFWMDQPYASAHPVVASPGLYSVLVHCGGMGEEREGLSVRVQLPGAQGAFHRDARICAEVRVQTAYKHACTHHVITNPKLYFMCACVRNTHVSAHHVASKSELHSFWYSTRKEGNESVAHASVQVFA